MVRYFASMHHNLTGLLRFYGRDTRSTFWPYAGTILGFIYVLTTAIILPPIALAMSRMQRFAADHPDQATITQWPGSYSITIRGEHPNFFPDMTGITRPMIFISFVTIVLLAASVVRRLHDRGRSGWWGALPLPFLFAGLVMMPGMFASFGSRSGPNFPLFFTLLANNLLYLVALIWRVVQLAGSGMKDGGAPLSKRRL